MAYFLDLFTPGNMAGIPRDRRYCHRLSGTSSSFGARASKGRRYLLCYLTRLSRWCGVLQAESEAYHDDSPIHDELEPFTVRFKVKPLVTLDPELAIPIRDDQVWDSLTITNQFEKALRIGLGFFRASLNKIEEMMEAT